MDAFRQFVDQSKMSIMWQSDGEKIHATANDGWILQSSEVMDLQLAGAHYRRNGTVVAKALEYLKIRSPQPITDILNSFPGTDRRFERLAENLYTDYGHHPTEIAAMLRLVREVSDHIVLVYQPHQNVRQHEVKNDYTDCFSLAEEIYWLPTYLSREDPNLPILTPEELTQNITNKDAVHIADLNDELWDKINTARQSGKLVLAMGAGSIDGWLRSRLTV
jgi:UDP-N-acetylmuramate--alanine ligase